MAKISLSHIDSQGEARMVDVGGKAVTRRTARVGVRVWMAPATLKLLQEQALPKGDVLAVAKVAGIMAAKRTSELVPLCHPLALTQVDLEFKVVGEESRIDIECETHTDDRTGVEMEALVGAAVAAITIYDMCKAVDRGMVIGDLRLLQKTGGKEDYVRPAGPVGVAGVAAGTVVAVNVSAAKGERKKSTSAVTLRVEHGIEGDAHAGEWHRQVSLLAQESIDKMTAAGLDVGPGDFAENITTAGLEVDSLPLYTTLEMGEALVEVTQIGKECHSRCAIYHQAGDCVMPREGIFVKVLRGGRVAPGDSVRVRAWGVGPTGVGASVLADERGGAMSSAALSRPIKAAVVTLSDKASAGLRVDGSGPVLRELLQALGAEVYEPIVIPDEQRQIESVLVSLADVEGCDLVLTTGGTGLAPRDRTPEATRVVIDRLAPGFVEAMRARSLEVTPHAMLSRAVAGTRGKTLIINMPGSPKACREHFQVIAPALEHAVQTLRGEAYECAVDPGAGGAGEGAA